MSERFTITVPRHVSERLPYDEFDSKSATIVNYAERGLDADEIEAERDAAEARADDLRRQLQAANSQADDMDDLAEYVREEKSLRREQAERQRRRREASLIQRAKWFVAGEPPVDDDRE